MKLKSLTTLLLIALVATGLTSCASKKKKIMNDSSAPTSEEMDDSSVGSGLNLELNGDSDSDRAGALKSVYFSFDSSALSTNTRQVLAKNAEYLKANDRIEIQIEGHCDERGGVQYNLALGEKRAKAVLNYLVAMGVAKNRLSTITYGKERPIAFGHDEESWAQNRRANFVITSK